jgi:hypothetical protein
MTPRRRFRRPYVASPLDPATFVRRIAAKAGTDYGIALAQDAFETVIESGDPEPWMREVQRARDAGLLGEEIAWFLLYRFVDAAMFMVVDTDPELTGLGARIDEIERAHGLDENDAFLVGQGPPEWEEATRAWTVVYDQRFAELFRRVGEETLAKQHKHGGNDPRYGAGREAIFGPLEELDSGEGLDDADPR